MTHIKIHSVVLSGLWNSLRTWPLLGMLILLGCGPSEPDTIHLQKERFRKDVQHFFTSDLKKHNCPGIAVAVVSKDTSIYLMTDGHTSLISRRPLTEHTLFRIASLSKGFTGILSAVLIQKGYFRLDDPLYRYVPDCPLKALPADSVIRIRHLLTHTTGLYRHSYSNLADLDYSRQQLLQEVCRLTPGDTTGTIHAYQNVAFALIEKVIEKTTSLSFEDALNTYLFRPLGMHDTGVRFSEICNSPNACSGYRWHIEGDTMEAIPLRPNYYNIISAGGIHSSIHDMSIWLGALLGNRPDVITEEVRELAFTPYVSTQSEMRHFNEWPGICRSDYGLGWRIAEDSARRTLIFHGGYVNGFRAEIGLDPARNLGMVILSNSTCPFPDGKALSFFQWYWARESMPRIKKLQ